MFDLKPLSAEGVPAALDKAMRYRLLNEPVEAESICLDVLALDPGNEQALVTLLLALSDQFDQNLHQAYRQARDLLDRLGDPYLRTYYDGILRERRAKTSLKRGGPGAGNVAYDWFRQAMTCFEEAERLSPADNDDAILRWNTCARIIDRHAHLKPDTQAAQPYLE